jgi:hypothetical protein
VGEGKILFIPFCKDVARSEDLFGTDFDTIAASETVSTYNLWPPFTVFMLKNVECAGSRTNHFALKAVGTFIAG